MKIAGFIMVGLFLLFILVGSFGGIYFEGALDLILALASPVAGLALIFIGFEDREWKKKTGFSMVGIFILLLLVTGFNFYNELDIIFRIGLLLIGLAFIIMDSRSVYVKSTTRTTSKTVNTDTEPQSPPTKPIIPSGMWKCPVDETFVDNESSVCPVCGYSRTQQQ